MENPVFLWAGVPLSHLLVCVKQLSPGTLSMLHLALFKNRHMVHLGGMASQDGQVSLKRGGHCWDKCSTVSPRAPHTTPTFSTVHCLLGSNL